MPGSRGVRPTCKGSGACGRKGPRSPLCVSRHSARPRSGASRLPGMLTGLMMAPPVLPALPAQPTLAVPIIVPPAAPPIDVPQATQTARLRRLSRRGGIVRQPRTRRPAGRRSSRRRVYLRSNGHFSSAPNLCNRWFSDRLPPAPTQSRICSACVSWADTTTPTWSTVCRGTLRTVAQCRLPRSRGFTSGHQAHNA